MKQRILIVLFGAIGDVTRALPLAVRIKKHWPQSHITWAVEPLSRILVHGHPAVDSVLVFERGRKLQGVRDFLRELQSQEKFDLTLDLQRHLKSGITTWKSAAPRRIGFHRSNSKEGNFLFQTETISAVENWSLKIEHYQKFGDLLGLPPMEPLEFGLVPTAEESKRVAELLEPFSNIGKQSRMALILGSSWPSRFWLSSRYRELVQMVEGRGMRCLLIGAKGERSIADEIRQGLPDGSVIDLVAQTSLRELLAVFSEVGVAVGSDSGPMHLAAAMGVPIISLWGSTSPLRSAPYGSEKRILQSAIGCSPCYRKNCPGLGQLCMSDIPASAVVARLDELRDEASLLGKS